MPFLSTLETVIQKCNHIIYHRLPLIQRVKTLKHSVCCNLLIHKTIRVYLRSNYTAVKSKSFFSLCTNILNSLNFSLCNQQIFADQQFYFNRRISRYSMETQQRWYNHIEYIICSLHEAGSHNMNGSKPLLYFRHEIRESKGDDEESSLPQWPNCK